MKCKSHPFKFLEDHIKEIKFVFHELTKFYDIRLNDEQKSLFDYLIKLHDIGKCNKRFQEYVEKLEKGEKVRSPGSHSFWSLKEIYKRLNRIKLSKKYLLLLLYLIAKHHSNLNVDFRKGTEKILTLVILRTIYNYSGKLNREYFEKIYLREVYEKCKDVNKVKKIYKELIDAFTNREIFLKVKLKNCLRNFSKEELILLADLYGIFKIADTISAKSRDLSEIKNTLKEITYIEKISEDRVKKLINKDIDRNRWKIQREISKYNYLFLRAPTGWGKTTTSLLFALNKDYRRIFITLPTITAIEKFYENLKRNFRVEEYFYLYDAKLILDNETERINNLYFVQNLLNPINITTFDQIILSFLQAGKYFTKRFNLRKSIIILDEIHLLTPQMLFLLKKFIEHLVPLYDIKLLLMSATLPKGIVEYLTEKTPIKFTFIDIYEIDPKYKERERVKIELVKKDILEDLDKIIEENRKNKSVLVIVNTVEKAVCIYKKLKEEYKVENVLLLHGRFMFKHRKEKERKIDEIINKRGIFVSTQVTEVSLDVDFDILFTEAAPISSIVQRLGRVNRRGKKKDSVAYIYYPKEIKEIEEDRRRKYPYSIEEIEKTWKFLEELKELGNFKEGKFIEKIDGTFTKEFYEGLIKKEKVYKLYRDVFENRDSDINVHWFLQSTSEERGKELLEFRESVTTLVIPYGDLVEKNIYEEISKLIEEYERLKNCCASWEKWREFFARAKTYAVPVPLYLVLNLEDVEKVGLPVIEKLKEEHNYKYFKEYGFVNLEKLEKFGCEIEEENFEII